MEQSETGKISKIRGKISEKFGQKPKPKEFSSFVDFVKFIEKDSDGVVAEATEKTTLTEIGLVKKQTSYAVTKYEVELRGVRDNEGKEETVCKLLIPCGEIVRGSNFSKSDSSDRDRLSSEEEQHRLKCFAVIEHKLRLVDSDKRRKVIYFGKEINDDFYNALQTTVKNLGISPVL